MWSQTSFFTSLIKKNIMSTILLFFIRSSFLSECLQVTEHRKIALLLLFLK